MNYTQLQAELSNDPVGLGYSGLSDSLAATKLNATNTNRTLARKAVSKNEILTAIVDSEWPTTGILQNKLLCIFSCDTIDASNANVKAVFAAIFGPATATRGGLLALGTQTVSRAVELGLGIVLAADVTLARSGSW
jgi:hypothetical protein